MHLQDRLILGRLIRGLLFLVPALSLALPLIAAAQTSTATLFIEARDESGALLPGVVISLTNQDTGIGRAGVTSPDGSLAVPSLPAGTYTLTAALDGFKTEIIRDIRVAGGGEGHAQSRAEARRR